MIPYSPPWPGFDADEKTTVAFCSLRSASWAILGPSELWFKMLNWLPSLLRNLKIWDYCSNFHILLTRSASISMSWSKRFNWLSFCYQNLESDWTDDYQKKWWPHSDMKDTVPLFKSNITRDIILWWHNMATNGANGKKKKKKTPVGISVSGVWYINVESTQHTNVVLCVLEWDEWTNSSIVFAGSCLLNVLIRNSIN